MARAHQKGHDTGHLTIAQKKLQIHLHHVHNRKTNQIETSRSKCRCGKHEPKSEVKVAGLWIFRVPGAGDRKKITLCRLIGTEQILGTLSCSGSLTLFLWHDWLARPIVCACLKLEANIAEYTRPPAVNARLRYSRMIVIVSLPQGYRCIKTTDMTFWSNRASKCNFGFCVKTSGIFSRALLQLIRAQFLILYLRV